MSESLKIVEAAGILITEILSATDVDRVEAAQSLELNVDMWDSVSRPIAILLSEIARTTYDICKLEK